MAQSKFAIFLPEVGGSLLVKELGRGSEGFAILVRRIADHQLYVRKQTHPVALDQYLNRNDVTFYRPHARVPALIDYQVSTVPPTRSLVTTWQFCNGGDLWHFHDTFKQNGEYFPELLIWRLLSQLFRVLKYLHFSGTPGIAHGDVHGGNVLLRWTDGIAMPDFYLGDFGQASNLGPTKTMPMLGDEDLIGHDLFMLARTVGLLMSVTEEDENLFADDIHDFVAAMSTVYSRPLLDVLQAILTRQDDIQNEDADLDYSDLQRGVIDGYNAFIQTQHGIPNWHRAAIPNEPMLFDSIADARNPDREPLHGSQVVEVDPTTFTILRFM